ncbi:hypothetical protein HK102_008768 [Quaeritorhiza haematococci]|nr:hypothetical protein HK102_008768 [Quaeritorhiza haematococci]
MGKDGGVGGTGIPVLTGLPVPSMDAMSGFAKTFGGAGVGGKRKSGIKTLVIAEPVPSVAAPLPVPAPAPTMPGSLVTASEPVAVPAGNGASEISSLGSKLPIPAPSPSSMPTRRRSMSSLGTASATGGVGGLESMIPVPSFVAGMVRDGVESVRGREKLGGRETPFFDSREPTDENNETKGVINNYARKIRTSGTPDGKPRSQSRLGVMASALTAPSTTTTTGRDNHVETDHDGNQKDLFTPPNASPFSSKQAKTATLDHHSETTAGIATVSAASTQGTAPAPPKLSTTGLATGTGTGSGLNHPHPRPFTPSDYLDFHPPPTPHASLKLLSRFASPSETKSDTISASTTTPAATSTHSGVSSSLSSSSVTGTGMGNHIVSTSHIPRPVGSATSSRKTSYTGFGVGHGHGVTDEKPMTPHHLLKTLARIASPADSDVFYTPPPPPSPFKSFMIGTTKSTAHGGSKSSNLHGSITTSDTPTDAELTEQEERESAFGLAAGTPSNRGLRKSGSIVDLSAELGGYGDEEEEEEDPFGGPRVLMRSGLEGEGVGGLYGDEVDVFGGDRVEGQAQAESEQQEAEGEVASETAGVDVDGDADLLGTDASHPLLQIDDSKDLDLDRDDEEQDYEHDAEANDSSMLMMQDEPSFSSAANTSLLMFDQSFDENAFVGRESPNLLVEDEEVGKGESAGVAEEKGEMGVEDEDVGADEEVEELGAGVVSGEEKDLLQFEKEEEQQPQEEAEVHEEGFHVHHTQKESEPRPQKELETQQEPHNPFNARTDLEFNITTSSSGSFALAEDAISEIFLVGSAGDPASFDFELGSGSTSQKAPDAPATTTDTTAADVNAAASSSGTTMMMMSSSSSIGADLSGIQMMHSESSLPPIEESFDFAAVRERVKPVAAPAAFSAPDASSAAAVTDVGAAASATMTESAEMREERDILPDDILEGGDIGVGDAAAVEADDGVIEDVDEAAMNEDGEGIVTVEDEDEVEPPLMEVEQPLMDLEDEEREDLGEVLVPSVMQNVYGVVGVKFEEEVDVEDEVEAENAAVEELEAAVDEPEVQEEDEEVGSDAFGVGFAKGPKDVDGSDEVQAEGDDEGDDAQYMQYPPFVVAPVPMFVYAPPAEQASPSRDTQVSMATRTRETEDVANTLSGLGIGSSSTTTPFQKIESITTSTTTFATTSSVIPPSRIPAPTSPRSGFSSRWSPPRSSAAARTRKPSANIARVEEEVRCMEAEMEREREAEEAATKHERLAEVEGEEDAVMETCAGHDDTNVEKEEEEAAGEKEVVPVPAMMSAPRSVAMMEFVVPPTPTCTPAVAEERGHRGVFGVLSVMHTTPLRSVESVDVEVSEEVEMVEEAEKQTEEDRQGKEEEQQDVEEAVAPGMSTDGLAMERRPVVVDVKGVKVVGGEGVVVKTDFVLSEGGAEDEVVVEEDVRVEEMERVLLELKEVEDVEEVEEADDRVLLLDEEKKEEEKDEENDVSMEVEEEMGESLAQVDELQSGGEPPLREEVVEEEIVEEEVEIVEKEEEKEEEEPLRIEHLGPSSDESVISTGDADVSFVARADVDVHRASDIGLGSSSSTLSGVKFEENFDEEPSEPQNAIQQTLDNLKKKFALVELWGGVPAGAVQVSAGTGDAAGSEPRKTDEPSDIGDKEQNESGDRPNNRDENRDEKDARRDAEEGRDESSGGEEGDDNNRDGGEDGSGGGGRDFDEEADALLRKSIQRLQGASGRTELTSEDMYVALREALKEVKNVVREVKNKQAAEVGLQADIDKALNDLVLRTKQEETLERDVQAVHVQIRQAQAELQSLKSALDKSLLREREIDEELKTIESEIRALLQQKRTDGGRGWDTAMMAALAMEGSDAYVCADGGSVQQWTPPRTPMRKRKGKGKNAAVDDGDEAAAVGLVKKKKTRKAGSRSGSSMRDRAIKTGLMLIGIFFVLLIFEAFAIWILSW